MSSKFNITNGGPVIGQCVGDNQNITMDFNQKTTVTSSQVSFSFILPGELRQKLPADKYDQMCKEIQDVIDKYTKGE